MRPHPVIGGLLGLGSLGVAQILDPGATSTIAATIQQVEGYYPGSLAYINNNPGNLKFVGQAGATAGANGFAQFSSYSAGLQALDDQIQLYAARGMSIQDMMNVYAPASDGNNPSSYAQTIASALGTSPSTSLLDFAMGTTSAPVPALSFDSADVLGSAGSFLASLDPAVLLLAAAALAGIAFVFSDD